MSTWDLGTCSLLLPLLQNQAEKKRAVNGSDMELVYCWFYFFVCAGTRDLGTCALCSDR